MRVSRGVVVFFVASALVLGAMAFIDLPSSSSGISERGSRGSDAAAFTAVARTAAPTSKEEQGVIEVTGIIRREPADATANAGELVLSAGEDASVRLNATASGIPLEAYLDEPVTVRARVASGIRGVELVVLAASPSPELPPAWTSRRVD